MDFFHKFGNSAPHQRCLILQSTVGKKAPSSFSFGPVHQLSLYLSSVICTFTNYKTYKKYQECTLFKSYFIFEQQIFKVLFSLGTRRYGASVGKRLEHLQRLRLGRYSIRMKARETQEKSNSASRILFTE